MDTKENTFSRWEGLLAGLPPERRQAMEFLRDHLPQSDLDCYPPELFLRFADHALMLRKAAAWCRDLDEEIFHHYVLFPRVNDEDLSFHREIFYSSLWPRVKDLPSQEDRILEVNRWCHEHACYQAQDERTASPLTVFRCGSGRCGEESAFLVSALRSVGIPARQVYAPRWSHCDDNHAWVEVLCGSDWRFLGACEPEPELDRGWFITAASRAMLVHSRIFGPGNSPLHGEFLSREGAVRWFNQTPRYARTQVWTFRALAAGKPASGARFRLQILNEASFHTIAVLTADSQGIARARLGLGSLHVLADWKGLCAESDRAAEEAVLQLAPPEAGSTSWVDLDFYAPAGGGPAPAVLSAAQKTERAETLRRGNALRENRTVSYAPPGEKPTDLLQGARGNRETLRAFLGGDDAPRRERLVRTLSDKDLRDVSLETLEDHFAHLPPRPIELPEEIYWPYVACPRIALEALTPWRESLRRWLTDWQGHPAMLWERLETLLENADANRYDNLYWTPLQALEAGGCDEKSRRVLLVAALRALGIPARLRPLDGEPEVWRDGSFCSIRPREMGKLHLSGTDQSWSLSRWRDGEWMLLHPADGVEQLTLPAGRYRLIASVRLPNGNQFASRRDLCLLPGEEKRVALRQRPSRLEDLLDSRPLPRLSAETPEGERIADLFRQAGGRPALAIWLEEGGEPTEHVLNELMALRSTLDALPVRLLFLLRGRESLEHPALAGRLADWDRAQVLLDDWRYDLELLARHLGCDPDAPPLAVVCDGAGRAVYSISGYRAGSVELLVRVAAHLCPGHKR